MDKTILHCDLNNFYASVEQILHPELVGHPIAVCGNPEHRHGIVLAKNQLAKKMNVTTGEALWEAKAKCPDIIFVPPTFEKYVEYSEKVFSIYTEFTDRVERFGIDECWLDVTASSHLFGSGIEIAEKIRQLVKDRTGLTISVGVSFTKVLAKLGSDMKKPDAVTVLTRDCFREKCYHLPVSDLIMVGKRTEARLSMLNVATIGDLARANVKMLENNFGVVGKSLWNYANGIEEDEVRFSYDKRVPKSVSNGTTTPRDIKNENDAKVVIYALSEHVAMRLRKLNFVANGISVSIRDSLLNCSSRQTTVCATSNADDIAKVALSLLKSLHSFPAPLRSITVGTFKFEDAALKQLSLLDCENDRKAELDKSIDKIRQKYGYHSIKRGVIMQTDLINDNLHEEDGFKPFNR
ncbi:MAG TPA: DNA polymerase IV [Clostridia bacterium]|nr:DNA polymerase IV [Clostridia bacterium]